MFRMRTFFCPKGTWGDSGVQKDRQRGWASLLSAGADPGLSSRPGLSPSWRLEVQGQGVCRGSTAIFSLCPHTAFPVCVLTSPSYRTPVTWDEDPPS